MDKIKKRFLLDGNRLWEFCVSRRRKRRRGCYNKVFIYIRKKKFKLVDTYKPVGLNIC